VCFIALIEIGRYNEGGGEEALAATN